MRDRLFDLADLIAEHLAKFVLLAVFIGCTLYLTIVAGPLGLLFGGIVFVFARWAWADGRAANDAPDLED